MPARILLPRFDTHGDIVLLEGFLEALLGELPDSKLTLLVRPGYDQLAPLLPSQLEWHVIELRPYETVAPGDGQMERIRDYFSNHQYDVVLATCFSQTWADAAVAALVNEEACRIALCGIQGPRKLPEAVRPVRQSDVERPLWDRTVVVDGDADESSKYQVLFEVLTSDGILRRAEKRGRPLHSEVPLPRLRIPSEREAEAFSLLRRAGLSPGSFVCCCPAGTANIGIKTWPSDRFAQVVAWLERTHRLPTLLVGETRERPILESVQSLAHAHGAHPRIWVGGDGQLPLLAALTSHARLYLGNDTAPMHLAAALNVPAVAIFGGGHWPRFVPRSNTIALARELLCYGCDWDCIFGDALCVKLVRTEDVLEAVDHLLAESPTRQANREPGQLKRPTWASKIVRLETPLEVEPVDAWLAKAERLVPLRRPPAPTGLLAAVARRLRARQGT